MAEKAVSMGAGMEGLVGTAAVERVGELAVGRAAVEAMGEAGVSAVVFVATAVEMVAMASVVGSAPVADEAPGDEAVSAARWGTAAAQAGHSCNTALGSRTCLQLQTAPSWSYKKARHTRRDRCDACRMGCPSTSRLLRLVRYVERSARRTAHRSRSSRASCLSKHWRLSAV